MHADNHRIHRRAYNFGKVFRMPTFYCRPRTTIAAVLALCIATGWGWCRSDEPSSSLRLRPISFVAPAINRTAADDTTRPEPAGFTNEEFASRRAKVYEAIGDDFAVMLGVYAGPNEYRRHRQHNNFYYLTGVETPNCALLLDGRAKQATLFVPGGRSGRRPQDLEQITARTGIERASATGELADTIKTASEGRKRVFMLTAPDEGYSQSRDSFFGMGGQASVVPGDPWILRAKQFRDAVKESAGGLEVANLQNAIDPLRRVKRPTEIAMMREAARIGAEAIADCIRGTRPGILERELEGVF